MSDMTSERVLAILEKTKKAVQMDSLVKLNGGFIQAVELEGQVYVVNIEKYVSANEMIKR